MELYTDEQLDEALAEIESEEKAIVVTPGGRVGNDGPFSRSRSSNWVARSGGLPRYIRIVAHGLQRKGKTESEAIRLAIGIVKNWASGQGHVSPKVRAAAVKAIAQWEAMRARAHVPTGSKKSLWEDPSNDNESKDGATAMNLEHKEVPVKGLTIDDEEQGIVTAIVSVTGIVDNVKDNILPGAYQKTLSARTPKGVWAHDWVSPVSKTLAVKELMPLDGELPKQLRNGEKWPKGAGALQVKMQFNLETEKGRDAFSNVKFYGDDQEWSIGFAVPTGGSIIDQKSSVREISTIDLFEFSPVLFGAMPQAVTTSVKTAQEAYRAVNAMAESGDFTLESKNTVNSSGNSSVDTTPVDGGDDDAEEDANSETMTIGADDLNTLYDLYQQLGTVLEAVMGDNPNSGADRGAVSEGDMTAKGLDVNGDLYSSVFSDEEYFVKEEAHTLTNIVDDLAEFKDDIANYDDLVDLAEQYDEEVSNGDDSDANDTASNFVDHLKSAMANASQQETTDAITGAAHELRDLLDELDSEDGSKDDSSDDIEEKSDEFVLDTKALELLETSLT